MNKSSMKKIEDVVVKMVEGVVGRLANKYGFDFNEAMELVKGGGGVEVVGSNPKEKAKKSVGGGGVEVVGSNPKQAICLTFGEQSENHAGMKINGNGLAESGFSIKEMETIKASLDKKGIECELHRLDKYLNGDENVEEAAVLLIRNGTSNLIGCSSEEMMNEQLSFNWDKQYWDTRRSRVLNKHARYNVCFGEKSVEPNYEEKQGRIVKYEDVPLLYKMKLALGEFFGEKAKNMEVEGNLYFDVKKCGIGFHGDGERKRIIACSLGEKRPIHWQWYEKSKPIGPRIKFEIGGGDMYIMSEKASGYDWKKRSKKTLRHAAGVKYVK